MTRQVTEGSPITVVARSQVGGFIPDAALNIDGDIYKDANCEETFDEHRANGAGEFVFYAKAGTVINVEVDDVIAVGLEPIQVVGVTGRPGGLAAVHPEDTPAVHEQSPISEHVTDSSLVGAVGPGDALPEEDGGQAAAVGVSAAQNVPPTTVDEEYPQTPGELMARDVAAPETPDGTAATDPDSVAPPSAQESQVTPMYEAVPTPGSTELLPESPSGGEELVPNAEDGVSTAQDVHGDSPLVDEPPADNVDGTDTSNDQQRAAVQSPTDGDNSPAA